jgi:hypothetical protein
MLFMVNSSLFLNIFFVNFKIFCTFSYKWHWRHPRDPCKASIAVCWFWSKKLLRHSHPLFKVVIATMQICEGDEIKWQSSNFVILWKHKNSTFKHWRRQKWLSPLFKYILYRLKCRKKLMGNLKKVQRKKIFLLKSMTKLEDLTVHW